MKRAQRRTIQTRGVLFCAYSRDRRRLSGSSRAPQLSVVEGEVARRSGDRAARRSSDGSTGDRPAPVEAVRAFGVMLGGPLALSLVVGASAATTALAIARGRRPNRLAAAITAALALYALKIRPWLLNWGSTPEERQKRMPEDELTPEGSRGLTRAVTVDAPVEQVWPWVAQLGQDRGGFYSYEWLENLAGCRMQNADRIHPDRQHREVGETVFFASGEWPEVGEVRAEPCTRTGGLGRLRARASR